MVSKNGGGASTLERPDLGRMREAVEEVARRVADMVRELPHTAVPIPNSEWTVGEAAAHLVSTQGLFVEGLAGASSPYGDGSLDRFPSVNARLLAELPEREGPTLADRLVERTQSFLGTSVRYREQHAVDYHFGPMDLPTWTSYMLFHLLMHGCDIARAMRCPLPVEPGHCQLTIPFLKAVMPRVFDENAAGRLRACYDVRLRGGGRFAVMISGGSVVVDDLPSERVDCHISADPVAFFLLASGRASQWGLIARGKLLAWGRRPWLGLKFKKLFPNP